MELVTRLFLLSPPSAAESASEGELDPPELTDVLDRLARRKPGTIVSASAASCSRLAQALVARTGAPQRHEPALDRLQGDSAGVYEARVLQAFDQFAREFQQSEVVVILPAEGIKAALARALGLTSAITLAPEAGQAIALDWPHPQAREIRHALIGIGFDWDVAPAASKVHRFPGGASVTSPGSQ